MAEQQVAEKRKRSLSLIQPTSVPTLGNYLGAMRGWAAFQQEFDTVYGVADLHSITVYGKLLMLLYIIDHQRHQLFWELIGAVVSGTAGYIDRHTIGIMESHNKVVCTCFAA